MNLSQIQIQIVKNKKKKERLEDSHGTVNTDLLVIEEFCITIWDGITVLWLCFKRSVFFFICTNVFTNDVCHLDLIQNIQGGGRNSWG